MKVLVIGGTLFIGKLLVEELLKEGHDVAVLHRKPKHDFGRKVENLMLSVCHRDPGAGSPRAFACGYCHYPVIISPNCLYAS